MVYLFSQLPFLRPRRSSMLQGSARRGRWSRHQEHEDLSDKTQTGPLLNRIYLYTSYTSTHWASKTSCWPAKNLFDSAHLSLLHPGHLNPICAEQACPLSKCVFAISASASINTGLPFKLSARFTVSGLPDSWITSRSSSYSVSMWSEVKAMGIRTRSFWPLET